jgi:hypothetical protein
MIAGPAFRLTKFLRDPLMRRRIQGRLAVRSSILLLGLTAVAFTIPLPCRVSAPVSSELKDAHSIYVTVAGRTSTAVPEGTRVAAGDIVGRLENPETRIEVINLTSQRDQQIQQLRHLETRRGFDSDAAAKIPSSRQMLSDLEERLRQLRRHEDMLVLKTPIAGRVIQPPRIPRVLQSNERLAGWSGTPLDPANRNCYLEAGTLFCLVGDPRNLECVAIVDQAEMELLASGQSVQIRLDQRPWETLRGKVSDISHINLDVAPDTLVAMAKIPVRTDRDGISRPVSTAYQVRIELDQADARILAAAPGHCKIAVAPQSIARRLMRYVNRNFRGIP